MSEPDEDKLYRERESARERAFDPSCEADLPVIPPDVDPVVPAEHCGDDSEVLLGRFVPANPVTAGAAAPDLLPDPLVVRSQEASATCSGGRTALAGTDPNVVEAGAQEDQVYLDDIPTISQNELFRLSQHIPALQTHVDDNLVAAILAANFTTFDQGIVTITGTSTAVALLIRQALVDAQTNVDAIAATIAASGLVCGWYNQELWVTCQEADPGYEAHLTDPSPEDNSTVAAGVFSSTVSQADANAQAAQYAAFALECLVANEEQDVSCSDVVGYVSEATLITWPVNWTKAVDPLEAAKGNEVVTLEDQGAGTWVAATWQDYTSNTESIALGTLNGQEFMQLSQVGTSERRTLRTRVIIEAGDPRAAALTLETANELAYNLAVSELDCFVPNRPQIVSCLTPTYGSAEVIARQAGLALSDDVAGRDTLHTELQGGDPDTYGGPEYARANEVVLSYGAPGEALDTSTAFEAWIWPGLFDGSSEAAAAAEAGTYGAGLIQCLWISPQHSCSCVDTVAGQTTTTGPGDDSAKFATDDVAAEGAILDASRSVDTNTISRGLILADEYPNKIVDPTYAAALTWSGLPDICVSGLSCLFVVCKTVCCEPKPDERPYQASGMPNYATWNGNWLSGAATQAQHATFLGAWNAARSAFPFSGCSTTEVGEFPSEYYDGCGITNPPSSGTIVHSGPVAYGMPARFKYGGLLKWGYEWAEPGTVDPEEGVDALLLPGTYKACHRSNGLTQLPDAWGLFHCAEGVAEGYSPFGLAVQATQAAIARTDCTHISWPRHIANCPEPHQKPFGPAVNLAMVTEAGSTRDANEQLENMLMQLMVCRDPGNFMITFNGGGGSTTMTLVSPAIANVGGKDECHPPGISEATLWTDCDTEADVETVANNSAHVYISLECCAVAPASSQKVKKLILHIVPDSGIPDEMRGEDQQIGELGLASGREAADTLRTTTGREVWYIGSYSVEDLGTGLSAWAADRMVAQVYSGPIVMDRTCCKADEPWDLVRSETAGDTGVAVGTILAGTDRADQAVSCTNPTFECTPGDGGFLVIKITERDPTSYTLEYLDEWPEDGGYTVSYSGKIQDGDFAFAARYFPLWKFTTTKPDGPYKSVISNPSLGTGVYGVRVAPVAHLVVLQSLYKTPSPDNEYVTLPTLWPYFRSTSS